MTYDVRSYPAQPRFRLVLPTVDSDGRCHHLNGLRDWELTKRSNASPSLYGRGSYSHRADGRMAADRI
ncbi:hypothetical protein [Pseudanabaena sp. FACHB-2040]|uniref:hypothetical protein n=1 Tax=Pseudanabaena sp. FACHB-2040 TaxID=2692859 RepID=UPI001682AF57|nr:hypothetical protein [Pseudanabaena sp. FACHB-2040]MBD2261211.1 hypothetical protein [Pseudanabaena sp. FACHB-2040]